MRKLLVILFLLIVGFKGLGQKCDDFNNLEDSLDVLMFFQMDVINPSELKKEIQTIYKGENYLDTIIVWENLKENDIDVVASDPKSLWVNQSVIKSKKDLKWIKTKQLYKKGKWIYFQLDVMNKKNGKTELAKTLLYKIRCDFIKTCSGNKSCYVKINKLK